MNLLNPYWARKRIAELDPEKDAREMAHLAFEVRYGMPLFTHAIFSVAFARQAAVPSIAKVLYRGGKGAIITNTRKRNNDTLLFFGELFRHGDSPYGQQVAGMLNHIHSHFPITNQENLYTLATLVCEPVRMSIFLTGSNLFSTKEYRGLFLFWKRMGELMGIQNIPDNEHELYRFYETFEKQNYAYSVEGEHILKALANEFAQRWYPAPLRKMGVNYYYALFDDLMFQTFRMDKPSLYYVSTVKAVLKFRLKVLIKYLPDASERSIIDHFSSEYKQYDISKVGPFAKTH